MWSGYNGIIIKDISIGNQLIAKFMGIPKEQFVVMDYDISWDSLIPVLIKVIGDKEINFFMKDLCVIIRYKGTGLYIGNVGTANVTNLHELIYQSIIAYIVEIKKIRL